ncbi:hypothetical protein Fcan01_04510 [Folsomia candida]|uniref:Uncharacterized protein n=1 Tax=Folsomia candida TaxID=158441 RepID=A0A226ES45_FOLCA|nr:hypothetical protein Fcan01_04510 [Folsomia candida]
MSKTENYFSKIHQNSYFSSLITLSILIILLNWNGIFLTVNSKYIEGCQCPVNFPLPGSYCGHEMVKSKAYFPNETATFDKCRLETIYQCNRTKNPLAKEMANCNTTKSPGTCKRVTDTYTILDEETNKEDQVVQVGLQCFDKSTLSTQLENIWHASSHPKRRCNTYPVMLVKKVAKNHQPFRNNAS